MRAGARKALVVGGTGMLRGVSLALARGRVTAVMARERRALDQLSEDAGKCILKGIPCDYRETDALRAAIEAEAATRTVASRSSGWSRWPSDTRSAPSNSS